MSKNPAISVIMPAYNTEKFIEKSIQSVLNQTMHDFELIIVNDGSTDHTDDIIKKYAEYYPGKIYHYNKENGGTSSARNLGMKYATGEYIAFIDSDDYIDPDYLDTLYTAGQAHNSDVVISGQNKVSIHGEIITTIKYPVDKFPYTAIRRLNISGKIYKREFVLHHGLIFPTGKIYEDNPFNLTAIFLSCNLVILPYVGYNQIVQRNTNTGKQITEKSIPYKAIENSIKYVLAHPNEINDYDIFEFTVLSFFTYFIFVANRGNLYLKAKQKNRKSHMFVIMHICDYVRRVISQNFPRYWKNPHVGLLKDRKELPLSQRAGVWVFVWLCRLNLLKPFAFIYYILR